MQAKAPKPDPTSATKGRSVRASSSPSPSLRRLRSIHVFARVSGLALADRGAGVPPAGRKRVLGPVLGRYCWQQVMILSPRKRSRCSNRPSTTTSISSARLSGKIPGYSTGNCLWVPERKGTCLQVHPDQQATGTLPANTDPAADERIGTDRSTLRLSGNTPNSESNVREVHSRPRQLSRRWPFSNRDSACGLLRSKSVVNAP